MVGSSAPMPRRQPAASPGDQPGDRRRHRCAHAPAPHHEGAGLRPAPGREPGQQPQARRCRNGRRRHRGAHDPPPRGHELTSPHGGHPPGSGRNECERGGVLADEGDQARSAKTPDQQDTHVESRRLRRYYPGRACRIREHPSLFQRASRSGQRVRGTPLGALGAWFPEGEVDIPPETDTIGTASNRVGLVGTFRCHSEEVRR